MSTTHVIILLALITGLRVHVYLKPKNGKGGFFQRIGAEVWFMGKKYDKGEE